MKLGQLVGYYLIWHYGSAFLDIWGICRNFLWFLYNFFSIPLLLKTLFSPFERLHETYKGSFNIGEFFGTLLVNILMRLVGAVLRLTVVILGTITLMLSTLISALLFAIWIVLPVIIPALLFVGLVILFR